jgi:hypothetical protein
MARAITNRTIGLNVSRNIPSAIASIAVNRMMPGNRGGNASTRDFAIFPIVSQQTTKGLTFISQDNPQPVIVGVSYGGGAVFGA